jgi:indole-3-glycerol phosphate synthase
MNVLDEIIRYKYLEVKQKKSVCPISELEKSDQFLHSPISLRSAIQSHKGSAVIAEFKRRSPSKGIINESANVTEITTAYISAGAVGVSILTDEKFFGGSQLDLITARKTITSPILRKDFIVDEYQIIEAKAIGADVILLIASYLTAEELNRFFRLAQSLKLEVLFEIYSTEEIKKLPQDAEMIGINNRDLKDFSVNIEHSINAKNLLPESSVKVAESGIHSSESAIMMAREGFDAFLIGEYFMKSSDPANTCKQFIEEIKTSEYEDSPKD